MNTRNRLLRGATVLATATLAMTLAACGSTGSAASNGPTNAAQESRYQATLDAWYKGTNKKPVGPSVAVAKRKSIWVIEGGLGSDYATRSVTTAQQVAAKLGWTVHIFDGKYDPTQQLTGVQQAVVAKADGILLVTVDCPTVKNGILQAKAAGIPIVGIESRECAPALLSQVVTYANHENFTDYVKDWGRAQVDWVIAKTNGHAKIVMDTETDAWAIVLSTAGIKEQVAKCPGCSILGDATFVATDLGPSLQQKIQQLLVQHPDANAYIPAYDVVMTQSGGAQALQASGRLHSLTIAGGEGSAAGIAQIRNGTGEQSCAGQSVVWEVYSGFDSLIRLFAHQDPNAVDTGNGIQVCDKDHNLPPAGQPYTPSVNFQAAFYKMWGLS